MTQISHKTAYYTKLLEYQLMLYPFRRNSIGRLPIISGAYTVAVEKKGTRCTTAPETIKRSDNPGCSVRFMGSLPDCMSVLLVSLAKVKSNAAPSSHGTHYYVIGYMYLRSVVVSDCVECICILFIATTVFIVKMLYSVEVFFSEMLL